MSYDIRLMDRVSEEPIQLPVKHIMTGGTYQADYDAETGTFSPAAINEAWLNITYNYSRYYYEAAEGDERFYGEERYPSEEEKGKIQNLGIRGIYGKSGAESISMLNDLVDRIEQKYKVNGKWISVMREEREYYDKSGNKVEGIIAFLKKIDVTERVYEIEVNEGNTDDYWLPTAANAIRPLHQLIAMASLRPDGVWDGD